MGSGENIVYGIGTNDNSNKDYGKDALSTENILLKKEIEDLKYRLEYVTKEKNKFRVMHEELYSIYEKIIDKLVEK